MNDQLIQQLTQAVQNMLQILQTASGASSGSVPPTSPDPTGYDDGDDGMPSGGGAGAMGDDDSDFGDDDDSAPPPSKPADATNASGGDSGGAGGAGSLHDRISSLERHTGLKKSAQRMSFSDRLEALEEEILGEAYEGPSVARVEQLEKALGHAAQAAEPAEDDSAPDVIDLGALIKTAIASAKEEFVAELDQRLDSRLGKSANVNSQHDLPDVDQLRVGRRKAVRPAIAGDEELIKSAQTWGLDGNLDETVSFGEILQLQYQAQVGGYLDDEDDSDE